MNADTVQVVVIIKPTGRLTAATSGRLASSLAPYLEDCQSELLVDCSQLHYISSAGWSVLLQAAQRRKQAEQPLFLCGMSSSLLEMVTLSGMDALLVCCASLEAYFSHQEALRGSRHRSAHASGAVSEKAAQG